MIHEIPTELIQTGGGVAVLVACLRVLIKEFRESRNGNGHASPKDRGMMLTSLLRNSEEVKAKLSDMATAQAIHGAETKRIVETQDRILNRMEDHDRRIRGVEIRQGDRKNAT